MKDTIRFLEINSCFMHGGGNKRKVKQIGDCTCLENKRAVKSLGGSTPSPSAMDNRCRLCGKETKSFWRYLFGLEVPSFCSKCKRKYEKYEKKKTRPSTSRPGVCDDCGCAVVRFHEEMHITAQNLKSDLNIDGHIYKDGLLRSVKCSRHTVEYEDKPAEDAWGGSGAHKIGPFTRYCVEGARFAPCCETHIKVEQALSGKLNYCDEKPSNVIWG